MKRLDVLQDNRMPVRDIVVSGETTKMPYFRPEKYFTRDQWMKIHTYGQVKVSTDFMADTRPYEYLPSIYPNWLPAIELPDAKRELYIDTTQARINSTNWELAAGEIEIMRRTFPQLLSRIFIPLEASNSLINECM